MPSPTRILYVDDNRDSRELVSLILRYSDMNCEIITADSAENAILLIKNRPFDFYILDYALPIISGVELCLQIRENDAETPILFFTAMARSEDRAIGINAGANDYLVKPDDLDALAEKVRRLLTEKKPASCFA
jgi:DNA-binding response OmpR family regulator